MKFKQGDYVRVIDREVTSADLKDGSFYKFFCGLSGTVDRVYDDEVCVNVELESLPEAIRKRHIEIQNSMKKKWIDGLSGEMRNRLTTEDKQFDLSYTILVRPADLEKTKPGDPLPDKPRAVETPKKEEKPAAEKPAPEAKLEKPAAKPAAEKPKRAKIPRAETKPAAEEKKPEPEVKSAEPVPKPERPRIRMSDPLPSKSAVKDLAAQEGLTPEEMAFFEERKKILDLNR